MASENDNPSNLRTSVLAPGLSVAFLVLLLSLATWYFFYMRSMPLSPGDIAVAVVFWLVVVIAGKWLVGRVALHRSMTASRKKKLIYLIYRAVR